MDALTQISMLKPISDPSAVSGVGGSPMSSDPAGLAVGQPDFGAMLSDMANKTVDTLQNAEAMSIKGIKGEASAHDVATAVMEAEQSLRMAISVRDKVVQAYLEISRMQI